MERSKPKKHIDGGCTSGLVGHYEVNCIHRPKVLPNGQWSGKEPWEGLGFRIQPMNRYEW